MKAGTLDRGIKLKLATPTLEVFNKNALPFTTETVNGPRFKVGELLRLVSFILKVCLRCSQEVRKRVHNGIGTSSSLS